MYADIATPALILDEARFQTNVAAMAAHAALHDIALRPHAKTHKCKTIAEAQIAAGAHGICVAKLGEAEALAGGTVQDILVTSPLVSPAQFERAAALAQTIERLSLVVDHPGICAALLKALAPAGKKPDLFVDLDVGTRRTGAAPGEASTRLARMISEAGFRFAGFQAYAGHVMHLQKRAERAEAAREAGFRLEAAIDAAHAAGLSVPVRTGGGTGTYDMDVGRAYSELQVGSYIFMDREYLEIEHKPLFEPSLFVLTTVISANQKGFVTTDAGFKSFATDGPRPWIHHGAPEGAKYFFMGDEHGGVQLPEAATLAPGDRLLVTVPHCDPTVNLYDRYHLVRDNALIGTWPIEARGRSQ